MTDERPIAQAPPPTSGTTRDAPPPKLASDAWRSGVAGVLSFAPAALYGVISLGADATARFDIVAFGFASWFFFGLLYVYLTTTTFSRADADTLTRWLRETTPRTRASRFWLWFSGGSGTSWASQVAVVAVLVVVSLSFTAENRSSLPVMIAAIGAVAGSWLLILAAFAVQYARADTDERGLMFPGNEAPAFIDYMYFAVQVSTAYSGADVAITRPALRRIVIWHSLIGFAFNSVIIAILISALLTAT